MKLLIDAGNTYINWATHAQGSLSQVHQFKFNKRGFESSCSNQWGKLEDLNQVVISNVAGDEFAEQAAEWFQNAFMLAPEFISVRPRAAGVSCGYLYPDHLGADRWAAMIGAWKLCHGPLCVVDVGTALKVDVVDAKGRHQGGLIAPGRSMMRKSLLDKTKNIKRHAADGLSGKVPNLLARDTADAIELGSLYAVVALVDRVVADVENELGIELHKYVTGGDSAALLPLLGSKFTHQPDLVLQGLNRLSSKGS